MGRAQGPHPSQEARWAPSSLCPPHGHRSEGPSCLQPTPRSRPTFRQHPWADTKPLASGKKVGRRTGSHTSWSRETWVREQPPCRPEPRDPARSHLKHPVRWSWEGAWGRVAGCPPGGGPGVQSWPRAVLQALVVGPSSMGHILGCRHRREEPEKQQGRWTPPTQLPAVGDMGLLGGGRAVGGAWGGLSPECPSRRAPGGNRTGW